MGINGWKRVWRETVRRFRTELNAADTPPAEGVQAMYRELAEAQKRLGRVATERDSIRAATARVHDERRSTRRRAALARDAGDSETAQIAEEYGSWQARHARVLEKKADALDAECAWLTDELRTMRRTLETRAERE